MQPKTFGPRSGLSEDAVVALIRDEPAPIIGAGLELIDRNLAVIEDISDSLLGGTVERDSYATLHGKAVLDISRSLDWAQAIVRPYVTINGVRFDMGAYLTEVNTWESGRNPIVYAVQGHDILSALNDRVGTGYSVAAGTLILTKVEEILLQQGFTQYVIDQSRATATMPSVRNWALDDNTRWLTIVNDMLAAVGYRGVWSDWTGALRCEPYLAPTDRASEWTYYGEGETSQLPLERVTTKDLFDAPNRWIAVRQNNIEGETPVEGNGVYTYINQLVGPTSVEARGGRIVTAPLITVDAADQSALVAAVDARKAADMANPTQYELSLPSPGNPLHWHFDRVNTVDPEFGLAQVMVTRWSLPLAPSLEDMQQAWMVLDA